MNPLLFSTPGKYLIGTLVLLLVLAVTYFQGRKDGRTSVTQKPQVQYVLVEKEVEKKKSTTKQVRKVTTKKEPSGTVITTIEESTTNSQSQAQIKEHTISNFSQKNYSLGINKAVSGTYEITGGWRVLENLWLDGAVPITSKPDASVGVSLKF